MGYTTYENLNNPHITIHKDGCNHLRKHGGVGRGLYKNHNTLKSARNYANSTGLPVWECQTCNP